MQRDFQCERLGRITCDPRIMKKKKKDGLILNPYTQRITDVLLLFYLDCGFYLPARSNALWDAAVIKHGAKFHCFSVQRVLPMTSKGEQIRSQHGLYIIDEV